MSVNLNYFFSWFKTAKRLVTKGSRDDLSLIRTNAQSSISDLVSRTGMRFNSRGQNVPQFSTRTRLRPGGPAPNKSYTATTLRNGSLPSVTATEGFEEIAMRTLNQRPTGFPQSHRVIQDEFLLNRPPFWDGAGSRLGCYPPTPLVKQRTNGCASPRVQMYKTRVFYSDKSPNSAVGNPGISLGGKNIPEAAVWCKQSEESDVKNISKWSDMDKYPACQLGACCDWPVKSLHSVDSLSRLINKSRGIWKRAGSVTSFMKIIGLKLNSINIWFFSQASQKSGDNLES